MARDITVSFDDGSSHVYRNAPDNITPDQAFARAQQDFAGKNIINLDGGRGIAPTAQAAPMAPKEPTPQEQSVFRQVADVPLQFATGVTQGVRMIADAFGAGNPLSKSLRGDRKSTRLNSSHSQQSRMPSSA